MLRTYPRGFAKKWLSLLPTLRRTAEGKPWPSEETLSALDAKALFAQMQFTDMVPDGGLASVVVYLRGNRHLAIPQEWRPFLPVELPVQRLSFD